LLPMKHCTICVDGAPVLVIDSSERKVARELTTWLGEFLRCVDHDGRRVWDGRADRLQLRTAHESEAVQWHDQLRGFIQGQLPTELVTCGVPPDFDDHRFVVCLHGKPQWHGPDPLRRGIKLLVDKDMVHRLRTKGRNTKPASDQARADVDAVSAAALAFRLARILREQTQQSTGSIQGDGLEFGYRFADTDQLRVGVDWQENPALRATLSDCARDHPASIGYFEADNLWMVRLSEMLARTARLPAVSHSETVASLPH
jgi:hypothetical protein